MCWLVNWERVVVLVDMELEVDVDQFYDTRKDLGSVSDDGLESCSGGNIIINNEYVTRFNV